MDINSNIEQNSINSQIKDEITNFLKLDEVEFYKYLNSKMKFRNKFAISRSSKWAVISFSSFCDNKCDVCNKDRSQSNSKEFRFCADEVIKFSRLICNKGIKNLLIEAGNDKLIDSDLLTYTIYTIKKINNINIALSICQRSAEDYIAWKIAGADYLFVNFSSKEQRATDLSKVTKLSDENLDLLISKKYKICLEWNIENTSSVKLLNLIQTIKISNPNTLILKFAEKEFDINITLRIIAVLRNYFPSIKIGIANNHYSSVKISQYPILKNLTDLELIDYTSVYQYIDNTKSRTNSRLLRNKAKTV